MIDSDQERSEEGLGTLKFFSNFFPPGDASGSDVFDRGPLRGCWRFPLSRNIHNNTKAVHSNQEILLSVTYKLIKK
jgi:hypothetical protein